MYAVLQKGKKEVEKDIKHTVLQKPWVQTVEAVRLKFALYLVELIENSLVDEFSKIHYYFMNPKEAITTWFEDQVDTITDSELQKSASYVYNKQFKEIWKTLPEKKQNNNKTSFIPIAIQVRDTCIDYLAEIDGILIPVSLILKMKKIPVISYPHFLQHVMIKRG